MDAWNYRCIVQFIADDPAQPAMHRCVDKSWAHQIDPDTLRREFRRNTAGQADQSMFGSNICGTGGKAKKGIYGSDIDDRTTVAAGEHGSRFILHAQIGAFQVDVENLIP